MIERSRLLQAPPQQMLCRPQVGVAPQALHRKRTGTFPRFGPQLYTFMLLFSATPLLLLTIPPRSYPVSTSFSHSHKVTKGSILSLLSQFCRLTKLFTSGFLHTLPFLPQRFCLSFSFCSFGSHHKHNPSQEGFPSCGPRLDPQHITVPHHTLVCSFFIII